MTWMAIVAAGLFGVWTLICVMVGVGLARTQQQQHPETRRADRFLRNPKEN